MSDEIQDIDFLESPDLVGDQSGEKDPFDDIPTGEINIDDYAATLQDQPKQEYSNANEKADTNTEFESGNPSEQKSGNQKANSDLIISLFDDVASFGMSVYSGEENTDLFRAKESQKKTLKENLSKYLETQSDFELSPIWGVVIVLIMAYLPPLRQAAMRGKAKKLKEQKRKEAEAEAQAYQHRSSQVENMDLSAFGSSEPLIRQEMQASAPRPVQDIVISQPEKKGKIIRDCAYCGAKTSNKKYCSQKCSGLGQSVKNSK